MKNASHELAFLVVKALAHYNINHLVISPGSRNAPLVNQALDAGTFSCHSCIDERSAGFKALGIAIHTGEPTALICTSGTAILNYLPAVCEAYYQGVPLVVISADRPQRWIDQGDGQTIRQQNALGSYVSVCQQLNPPKNDEDLWLIRRQIGEVFCAPDFVNQKRPVHINCSFEEPLYTVGFTPTHSNPIFREPLENNAALPEKIVDQIINRVNAAKKVLWIVGQLDKNTGKALAPLLERVKQLNQHVILSETTSNLGAASHSACIDRTIEPVRNQFDDFQPEVLIHLGGAIVSKKIKALLRKNQEKYTIRIHNTAFDEDTFMGLNVALNANPTKVVPTWIDRLSNNASATFNQRWSKHIQATIAAHSTFTESSKYSDFKVFAELSQHLPKGTEVFWGNSSPIRYAQLFDYPQTKQLGHFSNRGTSGIEGFTSTANGFATSSQQNTLLVTGDVSFHYDLNGLDTPPQNFKVLLINNGGGNIFRIIDGPDAMTRFEEFLETHHQKTAEHVSSHFGYTYQTASNAEELKKELPRFFSLSEPAILEVFTPRLESPQILKDYFKSLSKKA